MIIDKDKAYALAYDNNRFHTLLSLCEVSLTDGSVSIIADSIPYNFLDMESFCDLILDKEKSILYAVLMQKNLMFPTASFGSVSVPFLLLNLIFFSF